MGILRTSVAGVATTFIFAACAAQARAGSPLPEFALEVAPGMRFEVDARIELLAGAQAWTDWVGKGRGPGTDGGNAYYRALRDHLAGFSSSKAVRRSAGLMRTGFTYDAPCAFALSLEGGDAFAPPAAGWSDYLAKRALFPGRLGAFARELSELYGASDFGAFLERHRGDYERWLGESAAGFEGPRLAAWLEDFYAPALPVEYRFVFAPAMFPSGGYAATRTLGAGDAARLEIFQVIRAGLGADGPEFPSGASLAALAVHEFGHAFVNPAIERHSGDRRLQALFEPVAKTMRDQAYGQVPVFMNELVLRAACILAEEDLGLGGPGLREARLLREEDHGFHPIRRVVELLEAFRARRDAYPDFESYAPVLVEALASEANVLAAAFREREAGLEPVAAFVSDFSADSGKAGPPAGFGLGIGATVPAGGGASLAELTNEATPRLRLAADADTAAFVIVTKPVAAGEGRLEASWSVEAEEIRKEGGQFGGSYIGFIVRNRDGSRRFAVRTYAGSFARRADSVTLEVDPRLVESIDFAVFLNETGTLWVDGIGIGYR